MSQLQKNQNIAQLSAENQQVEKKLRKDWKWKISIFFVSQLDSLLSLTSRKKRDKNQNKRFFRQRAEPRKFWTEEIRANKSDWRKISDLLQNSLTSFFVYLPKRLSDWQEPEARLNLSRFFFTSNHSCVQCSGLNGRLD